MIEKPALKNDNNLKQQKIEAELGNSGFSVAADKNMLRNLLMKWVLSCITVIACVLMINHDARCAETYYVGSNRVLLYKIINWWYDCIPEESTLLCESIIKCKSKGDTQVVYNDTEMILKLRIIGGFADQLSIFKECKRCLGPAYLKCTWLNRKYFGNGEAAIVSDDFPAISTFRINNIDKHHGRTIQRIEKDIAFELEGSIGGLLDGRIALHQAGNLIKSCSYTSRYRRNNLPTSLKIINSNTKEVLATYSAIIER